MPYKNKDKVLLRGRIYHAYNRGYDKRKTFHDIHDYRTFLFLIKKYLDPNQKTPRFVNGKYRLVMPEKLIKEVELMAYCLMPNHFHLLLRQRTIYGMAKLVGRISSSYTQFYNKKYNRQGALWQDSYKAVLIEDQAQLFRTADYIHYNPKKIIGNSSVKKYPYSSLQHYVDYADSANSTDEDRKKISWISINKLLPNTPINQL